MSALVVDTSVWVTFFRGQSIARLEQALSDGDVVLAPIVAAELGSAPLATQERRKLDEFLRDLPLAPTPLDHWLRVGALRAAAARKGLTVSTPTLTWRRSRSTSAAPFGPKTRSSRAWPRSP